MGLPFTLFDADRSNPDVKRIYKGVGCRTAVLSENEKHEDTANAIYEAAIKKTTLVNLPAQVFIPFTEWFEKNGLFEIAPDDGVNFFHWFVCDGGYDSIELLKRSLLYFKGDLQHVLVKNWGKCDDWEPLETDEYLQGLINKYVVAVIDFPKFIGNADRNRIDSESLTFGEARKYKKFGSISRNRVDRFLKKAYQAFEKAEVFASEINNAQQVAIVEG